MGADESRADIPDAVRGAARAFAEGLRETPQFQQWREALAGLGRDEKAMATARRIRELQSRVRDGNLCSLRAPLYRKELEEVSVSYRMIPAVASYLDAEAELRSLCQDLDIHVSEGLEIDFALHGASSRCG